MTVMAPLDGAIHAERLLAGGCAGNLALMCYAIWAPSVSTAASFTVSGMDGPVKPGHDGRRGVSHA